MRCPQVISLPADIFHSFSDLHIVITVSAPDHPILYLLVSFLVGFYFFTKYWQLYILHYELQQVSTFLYMYMHKH